MKRKQVSLVLVVVLSCVMLYGIITLCSNAWDTYNTAHEVKYRALCGTGAAPLSSIMMTVSGVIGSISWVDIITASMLFSLAILVFVMIAKDKEFGVITAICIMVVVLLLLLFHTSYAQAGDRSTWTDIRNSQTRAIHGKQWVVIKETYCMLPKYGGSASYSTRYYVYEDEQARYILNDFKPSRNRHAGVLFIVGLEDVSYWLNRHGANQHMRKLKQSDVEYNRRLR